MGTEQALSSLCGWWQNARQFGNSRENDPQACLQKGGWRGGLCESLGGGLLELNFLERELNSSKQNQR